MGFRAIHKVCQLTYHTIARMFRIMIEPSRIDILISLHHLISCGIQCKATFYVEN